MVGVWQTVVAVVVLGLGAAQRGNETEPTLPATTERLAAAEEKAVRHAIYERAAATGIDENAHRVLSVPDPVQLAYTRKPQATVRLLMKIVDGGRAQDSIHAAACVQALVESPVSGALFAGISNATWDGPLNNIPKTMREHFRGCLVRQIVERERGTKK
jgi:hypothetical protein